MDYENLMKELGKTVNKEFERINKENSMLKNINTTMRRFGNEPYLTDIDKDDFHQGVEFGFSILFSGLYLLGNIID